MIYSFKDFLLEANSAGSKFEQKIAKNINKWIKNNHLTNKFHASRYQSISESDDIVEQDGNRDEDYSDIVVDDLQNSTQFFVECKEILGTNIITTMFDINEQDFHLIPVKNKSREQILDDELLNRFAADIFNTDEYQKFCDFLCTENDRIHTKASPADFYFDRQDINDQDLGILIHEYNKIVKDGEVEADNKPFDDKLIRESTRNTLAIALMWRLYDINNTWDICHLKDISYFNELVRKHYLEDKAMPAKYLQTGDRGLFILDENDNPLNIECDALPQTLNGRYDLKFTPRVGTGSCYITPRSKITDDLQSACSFANEDQFPQLLNI